MQFQTDKLKHLAIGLCASSLIYLLTRDIGWTWAATIALAAAKEAYDATGRGHVELRDFIATILPACVPTLVAMGGV